MTKQQELALLEETISAFGPASYLGPWLSAHREQIASDIRADVEPAIATPGECYRIAAAIVTDAQQQAARITSEAEQHAAHMRAEAQRQITEQRQRARLHIERIAREL